MRISPSKLRAAMEKVSITQERLAERVGLSQPSIARLLSGETRSTRAIFKISAALSVDPAAILEDEGDLMAALAMAAGPVRADEVQTPIELAEQTLGKLFLAWGDFDQGLHSANSMAALAIRAQFNEEEEKFSERLKIFRRINKSLVGEEQKDHLSRVDRFIGEAKVLADRRSQFAHGSVSYHDGQFDIRHQRSFRNARIEYEKALRNNSVSVAELRQIWGSGRILCSLEDVRLLSDRIRKATGEMHMIWMDARHIGEKEGRLNPLNPESQLKEPE